MKRNSGELTKRDLAILDALALRVRVLAIPQVARHWFGTSGDPIRAASRRLDTLASAGLIELFSMPAIPELELEKPLARWAPGQLPPDLARVSSQLIRRWRKPAIQMHLAIASRRGGVWLGGSGGRRPRRSEVSHDLALAGLYLRWSRSLRQPGDEWVSEARLVKMGFGKRTRVPDGMIVNGSRYSAVEIGGAYSAEKLAAFHRYCHEQSIPYELW